MVADRCQYPLFFHVRKSVQKIAFPQDYAPQLRMVDAFIIQKRVIAL